MRCMLRHARFLIILICLLPFLTLPGTPHVQAAPRQAAHPTVAVNCSKATCYGVNDQLASDYSLNLFNGVRTTILSVPQIRSNDHITDELWLAQSSSSGCPVAGGCWVEVGLEYQLASFSGGGAPLLG